MDLFLPTLDFEDWSLNDSVSLGEISTQSSTTSSPLHSRPVTPLSGTHFSAMERWEDLSATYQEAVQRVRQIEDEMFGLRCHALQSGINTTNEGRFARPQPQRQANQVIACNQPGQIQQTPNLCHGQHNSPDFLQGNHCLNLGLSESVELSVVSLDTLDGKKTMISLSVEGKGAYLRQILGFWEFTVTADKHTRRHTIMGDPLSVASGLIAVVTATLQSSKILYETIQSFRNHRTAVSDLLRELKGLQSVLGPLQDHVRTSETAFLPLKFPLIQCQQACVDFKRLVEKSSMRSRGESRTSFRDWAKLMYMNGDIASFREMLAGYKSTITIALADANLRSSKVTLEVLNDYKNLISDTKLDLENHLKSIDSKLQDLVSQDSTTGASKTQTNLQKIEIEKESTERCLDYCKHLLEQINNMHFQPILDTKTSSTTAMSISPESLTLADSLTLSTLKACSYNLSDTITRLESHRITSEENLQSNSWRQDPNQDNDPSASRQALQDELESTKQCLGVCDRASEWASSGKVHIVEDISVGNNGKQICVSTLGDLFNIKSARAGHGAIQFFGSVSERSLSELLRSQSQQQIVHNESTIDEICLSGGGSQSRI
ncbi:hypothetical protein FAVG1_11818 [Fusarium avenaceum]|nr:hypothetical protein FAVG1_11818 [Fusarium avenaceum]